MIRHVQSIIARTIRPHQHQRLAACRPVRTCRSRPVCVFGGSAVGIDRPGTACVLPLFAVSRSSHQCLQDWLQFMKKSQTRTSHIPSRTGIDKSKRTTLISENEFPFPCPRCCRMDLLEWSVLFIGCHSGSSIHGIFELIALCLVSTILTQREKVQTFNFSHLALMTDVSH